jgi:DNA polymerase II small subunit
MNQSLTERVKEVIQYASEKNVLIDENAALVLGENTDFKEIIDELIEKNHFILSKELVEEKIVGRKTKIQPVEEKVVIKKTVFKPVAKEYSARYRILEDLNVTNKSFSEGTVKDFLRFFRDKFEVLEKILSQRNRLNPKPIKKLRSISRNKEVELIGMVSDKFESRNGNLILQLEDLEAQCIAVVLKKDLKLFEIAKTVLVDNVIGIKGVKASEEMIIVKEIIFPEIPQRPLKKINEDLSILLISDLHVGSKLFLENAFKKFLAWLKGEIGSEKEKEKVGKVKYLMICGDTVDGIGIYPGQVSNLAVKDIYRQYELLSNLLMEVPEYIEVFIIPGQHDAVRWSDPQHAIPKEFLPELYSLKNFHFLSSPGWSEIEGLKVLQYHCPSLHDLYSSIGHLSYSRPQDAMIELLKRRDLMPCYGLKRTYVPEKKDFMVLREVPDIFLGGDLHHNGYTQYRGTMILSCGCWQERTEYEIQKGHIPTPGIAAIYNLKDNSINETYFYRPEVFKARSVFS